MSDPSSASISPSTTARSFAIGDSDFLLDGQPFRIISGALHYFRVHPDQWADRIRKARLMGLNTIETYVPWNEHFPTRDRFVDSGGLDLKRFLELVAAEGLYAIVRPGPYICAEWDNGGLPAWLFTDASVGVRTSEFQFMYAVTEYFRAILPIVAPLQLSRSGPVILMQIENEYGAYGNDKDYLRSLVELVRDGGITVPLTTIDQPTDQMLSDGGLPGLHKTGSFGGRSLERLETLRRHQPTGPLMCAEFWDGWFDNWGAHHRTTSAAESAAELDALLASGASVNIYMFHGGTNFGFTNGANDKGVYQPTVTSYDYDAPLSESGEPGPKYWAFRDVIARHAPVPEHTPAPRVPPGEFSVRLDRVLPLMDALPRLGEWTSHAHLPTLDEISHFRGFAIYRTRVPRAGLLRFSEIRDRGQLFLDGRPIGVVSRDHHDSVALVPGEGELDILVEDQGRVNYGPQIGEPKGLIGPAHLDGQRLEEWNVLPLDFSRLLTRSDGALVEWRAARAGSPSIPGFAAGSFELEKPTDLFLSTVAWGKGIAFINGFNLGRYWSRGPQAALFVPAPVLRPGRNELVIFELNGLREPIARFVREPALGHTEA